MKAVLPKPFESGTPSEEPLPQSGIYDPTWSIGSTKVVSVVPILSLITLGYAITMTTLLAGNSAKTQASRFA